MIGFQTLLRKEILRFWKEPVSGRSRVLRTARDATQANAPTFHVSLGGLAHDRFSNAVAKGDSAVLEGVVSGRSRAPRTARDATQANAADFPCFSGRARA